MKLFDGSRQSAWVLTALILTLAACTYITRFAAPASYYWDENYHISSAQKYLTGTYFMEPHPPLGKLLIAAGEKLLNLNEVDDSFIGMTKAKDKPSNFSFAGYRLFPVLLGWLTAALVFWIFLLLTKNQLHSTLFSLLYVFDNALIVHNRAAMLESTMLFFCCALVLLFLYLRTEKLPIKNAHIASVLFGIAFACVMTTKLLGLIMILLIPALLPAYRARYRQFAYMIGSMTISFLVVYVAIWQVHFATGNKIVGSLPNDGYFRASDTYKEYLETGKNTSLLAFPVMLRDSTKFVKRYSDGVPRLNFKKPVENGSPFFLWPTGGRTISYRWQSRGEGYYSYLYLVPNAVGWFMGLFAVLATAGLLFAHYVVGLKTPLRQPYLLAVFGGMYISYMIAVAQISRVMYLYHYFIPLLLSYFLLAVVFYELRQVGPWQLNIKRQTAVLTVMIALLFLSFQWFRPLTYNLPLTHEQFAARNLLPWWDMRCAKCKSIGYFARPVKKKKSTKGTGTKATLLTGTQSTLRP